jgi:hypothetical protein
MRQANRARLVEALRAADTVRPDEVLRLSEGEGTSADDGERGALCAVLLREEKPYEKWEVDVERAALCHADAAARAERLLGRPAALVLSCPRAQERARALNNAGLEVLREQRRGNRGVAPAAPTHQQSPSIKSLRCDVDWRRAFATTHYDGDPLFRSFVHWQVCKCIAVSYCC